MVIKDIRYMWSEIDSPLQRLEEKAGGAADLLRDTEATPSFTLDSLEALEHMEEWDWGIGVDNGRSTGDFGSNFLNLPWLLGVGRH
jgi:hypothetical protein